MKKDNFMPNWVRWMLLMPCSILACAFVGSIIIKINAGADIYGTEVGPDVSAKSGAILSSIVCPLMYLYIGYLIAPKYKMKAVLVLLILALSGTIILLTGSIFCREFNFYYFLQYFLIIICLFIGYKSLKSKELA